MSWTTSPPYSSRSVSRQPTESTAITTPPPGSIASPKPAPRSLTLLSSESGKSRTPISPHKLAKLANALGVATPAPASAPYPLYSPTSANGANSFGHSSSSTPSRYLIHVIPPHHLLLALQEDPEDAHERSQLRRGTLVPLHPTLNSQLGAIAREYSLPSIGGMILYLIADEAGPRITDDAWRMLWYRALQMEKDGSSTGKSIARHHSRNNLSSSHNSPYPSPSTTESPYQSGSPSVDNISLSSNRSLDLPVNLNPSSALPILAKVEFDIEKRKAPWYERWKQQRRRRTTSHSSVATSPHLLGTFGGSSSRRELQLPLRARSTSPSLAEFKAKYAPTSPSASASSAVNLNSPDEFSDDAESGGYVQLDDDGAPKRRRKLVHEGEFTDDPLNDVFPSDQATWARMKNERKKPSGGDENAEPQTPDIMIGGRIGSTILGMEHDSGEESPEEDAEDVITMWKEKHRPTLDGLSAPASPASSRPPSATRSRSASKHIPPPLDLAKSSKSQIPHVEIAPPTATSPNMSVNSDLPYLDSDGSVGQTGERFDGVVVHDEDGNPVNENGIQIVIDASTSDEGTAGLNTGSPRRGDNSSTKSEEVRRYRLDELERRIENFSPKNKWEHEDNFEAQQDALVDSPESTGPAEMTPRIAFHDEDGDGEQGESSVPLEGPTSNLKAPSTKASRRQVSIGSFNSIPGAADLAQALAGAPSPPLESPPLPPLPPKDIQEADDADDEREASRQKLKLLPAPIDLSSPSPTPTTPGFPMSPDPFHRDTVFGRAVKIDIPARKSTDNEEGKGSPVSPPIRVSSRFSADSAASDDAKDVTRSERTNSIMSVKGIRSLWRKSGNKGSMPPLMSPGINGQQMIPPTPPPFSGAPPLPIGLGGFSAGGFMTTTTPPMSRAQPSPPLPPSPNPPSTPTPASMAAAANQPSRPSHGRSDSGLDPFRFDQESRYPVHKTPSPSQAFTDVVPPPALLESLPSPPLPSAGGSQKKGILKGWSSKSSLKRASGDLANAPPSSFASGKKQRKGSVAEAGSTHGHSKSNSKASISSVGTNGKNSGSGTSYASSHGHQAIPVPLDPPPSLSASPIPPSGRSSPASISIGHKSTGSNGSALTATDGGRKSSDSARKSTPPPPGAVANAVAVAASREKRGTSYIGPSDNRI